ncbi:MAG: hypothetical protein WAS33_00175 [Candidatus Promineifilaceae bacterium]|nr:hypothetical protein [Anaerolineaceae bacterium]
MNPKEELLRKTGEDKIIKNRRIAFQIPHIDGDACGRSFEDAFLLANPRKFEITGENLDEREDQSWKLAAKINKTDFAMNYAILDTDWVTPRYIKEGLKWLVGNTSSIAETKSNSPIIRVELEESVDA